MRRIGSPLSSQPRDKRPALVVLVPMLLALACATPAPKRETMPWPEEPRSAPRAQARGPARAEGVTFSIPLPPGFTDATGRHALARNTGGVLLVRPPEPGAASSTRASILVLPVELRPPEDDLNPNDDASCALEAKRVARVTNLDPRAFKMRIVDTVEGASCQVSAVSPRDSHAHLTATAIYTETKGCLVLCAADTRDAEAGQACDEVLGGWQFKAPAPRSLAEAERASGAASSASGGTAASGGSDADASVAALNRQLAQKGSPLGQDGKAAPTLDAILKTLGTSGAAKLPGGDAPSMDTLMNPGN